MDLWTQILANLGIGGACLYLLWDQNSRNSKQIDDRDKTFREYAEKVNKELAELAVQSTMAHRDATRAIEKSTAVIEGVTATMKQILDHLIKH